MPTDWKARRKTWKRRIVGGVLALAALGILAAGASNPGMTHNQPSADPTMTHN